MYKLISDCNGLFQPKYRGIVASITYRDYVTKLPTFYQRHKYNVKITPQCKKYTIIVHVQCRVL